MLSVFTTNASAATNLGKVTGLKQVYAQTGEVRFTFDTVLYPGAVYEIYPVFEKFYTAANEKTRQAKVRIEELTK